MAQRRIIIIDWGTSRFRAYFVVDGKKTALRESDDGVLSFKNNDMQETSHKAFLKEMLGDWLYENVDAIVMTGMVGSSVGWKNVDALSCPVDFDSLAKRLHKVDFDGHSYIVPGLATENFWHNPDFMRGEESQLFGWWLLNRRPSGRHFLCLPGTHTKWVHFEHGRAVRFSSALTGELFQLLHQHSILASPKQDHDQSEFIKGVNQARIFPGLSHQLFAGRSRVLAGLTAPEQHCSYVSGLLIGDEIRSFIQHFPQLNSVEIIGAQPLIEHYKSAMEQFNIQANTTDADACLLAFVTALDLAH